MCGSGKPWALQPVRGSQAVQGGCGMEHSVRSAPRTSWLVPPAEPATLQCSLSMSHHSCPTGDSHPCPLQGSGEATEASVTKDRGLGCCCASWEAQGQGEELLGEPRQSGCAEPEVLDRAGAHQDLLARCPALLSPAPIVPYKLIRTPPQGRMGGDFSWGAGVCPWR